MAKQEVKNYIRLDKIKTTAHIESIVDEENAILNGLHVVLGDVIDSSQGEEMSFTVAEEGGEYDAFVANVYLTHGQAEGDILYESVEAGRPARAIIPEKGNIISINAELAEGVSKGDDVAVGPNGLGYKVADEGDVVVGRAIDTNVLREVGNLVVIRLENA